MDPNHPSEHERIKELRDNSTIKEVHWLYSTRHNGGDTYRIDFKIAPKRKDVKEILEPYDILPVVNGGVSSR